MFIQVIEGRTKDPEGLKRQGERWADELGPGAKGWLGSTGGATDDGRVIFFARFESEAAARANSERPEQGAWWNETSKFFDGDVTFRNCAETDTTLAGGSDDAGFVQVMQGRCSNRAKLVELEATFIPQLTAARPEVIGSTRAWDGDLFTEAIYFSNEAEARKGEQQMAEGEPPPGLAEYNALFDGEITFFDLKDPWLSSP